MSNLDIRLDAYEEPGSVIAKPLHLVSLRCTPYPVIATLRDDREYIRVLLCSSFTTIAGWGILLKVLFCLQRTEDRIFGVRPEPKVDNKDRKYSPPEVDRI